MIKLGEMLFVENPKTASKSVRTMLEKHGGTDIGHNHWNLRNVKEFGSFRYRVVMVRNPFDRMVSGFHYATRGVGDFKSWVKGMDYVLAPGIDFKRTSQLHWTCQCNVVLKFEEMDKVIETFRTILDNPDLELPHNHKTQNRKPYQEYYDAETRAIIEDRFAMDILKMGYAF